MHLRDPDERVVHALEAVERFVETAAARGVDEIGFTEHVYYFRQTRPVWTLRVPDSSAASTTWTRTSTRCSRRSVRACRSSSGSRSTTSASGRTSSRPSSSRTRGTTCSAPCTGSTASRSTRSRACGRSRRSTRCGGATSRRWPSSPASGPRRRARASRISRRSSARRPERIEYPQLSRRRARDLDGRAATSRSASCTRTPAFLAPRRLPITLASDAHVPQNVGRDLDRAVELARAAGYETVTVFEGRRGPPGAARMSRCRLAV